MLDKASPGRFVPEAMRSGDAARLLRNQRCGTVQGRRTALSHPAPQSCRKGRFGRRLAGMAEAARSSSGVRRVHAPQRVSARFSTGPKTFQAWAPILPPSASYLPSRVPRMSSDPPDFPAFTRMLKWALGERVNQGAASFVALLAEDVEVEHPYAPDGPRRLAGKQAVRAHVQDALSRFAIDGATARRVYRSCDRGIAVVEFSIGGRRLGTGAPFRLECVSIVETNGGLITCYRDYWNPLAISG